MNVGITSAILAIIICLTMAIAVLFRRPRRPVYIYFSVFAFTLFLWHGGILANLLSNGKLNRWPNGFALLIPPVLILFFRELLHDRNLLHRSLTKIFITLSSLLLIANFSPWGESLFIKLPMALYILLSLGAELLSLFKSLKQIVSENERRRLSYLLYGGLITLLLASAELIPKPTLMAAIGHVSVTFYLYFLYQSVVARRLIDLVDIFGKTAVLAVLTLILATVYALLLVWVGSNQQDLWMFNTLVASFVILILYDQIKPLIEELTAKLLFRERYELKQTIFKLLHTLRTTISIEDMRDAILAAFDRTGRINQMALYLALEDELSFKLVGYLGVEPALLLNLAFTPAFLQELHVKKRPIFLETLLHRYAELPDILGNNDPTLERKLERLSEAIASMRALRTNALIPMLVKDRLLGVLTIGVNHPTASYSAEEVTALLSLAEACAIVIENSHEYEKRRERDRLAAIGEMATGMAHEIRNPLGAIKGAAQCLELSNLEDPTPTGLPDEAREFIEVIIEEVDRLNSVVSQFLEYARPWRGNPVPTNVNEIIQATTKLLTHDKVPRDIDIALELKDELPLVLIDKEQLKQVLMNLLLNAIQALPKGGHVIIKTELDNKITNTQVCIRVIDNGAGIRQEDLQRIFVPFFTTKTYGTGLGLSICQKIVENAGGRLEVSSHPNAGSIFTVKLPA